MLRVGMNTVGRPTTQEQDRKGSVASAPKGTVLSVNNLSHEASEDDIKHFFEGFAIVAIEGFRGCARVQFASADEAERARQSKKGQMMEAGGDTRRIMDLNIVGRPPAKGFVASAPKGTVLSVNNLSSEASEDDIKHFFEGFAIVAIERHQQGAYVQFASADEAERAMQVKEGQMMEAGHDMRRIDLKFVGRPHLEGPKGLKKSAPKGTVLSVNNLSSEASVEDIKHFFDGFAIVAIDGFRGHAYVQFASADEAERAMQVKEGQMMEAGHDTQRIDMKFVGRLQSEVRRGPKGLKKSAPKGTVLSVNNLSSEASEDDIKHFFEEFAIVAIERHQQGAYVQFASADEAEQAMQSKKGQMMEAGNDMLRVGINIVGRPQSEVGQGPKGLKKSAPKGTVLSVNNLSYEASEEDIKHFFEGFAIVAIENHLQDAYVQFASADEAERAMQAKNMQTMNAGGSGARVITMTFAQAGNAVEKRKVLASEPPAHKRHRA